MRSNRKHMKHSLKISRRFEEFWDNYRGAVMIFYLYRGIFYLWDFNKEVFNDWGSFMIWAVLTFNYSISNLLSVAMALLSIPCTCCLSDIALSRCLALNPIFFKVSQFDRGPRICNHHIDMRYKLRPPPKVLAVGRHPMDLVLLHHLHHLQSKHLQRLPRYVLDKDRDI